MSITLTADGIQYFSDRGVNPHPQDTSQAPRRGPTGPTERGGGASPARGQRGRGLWFPFASGPGGREGYKRGVLKNGERRGRGDGGKRAAEGRGARGKGREKGRPTTGGGGGGGRAKGNDERGERAPRGPEE